MDDLLKDLNEEQKQAVTHGEDPLLIVAGAGTGKTTVITRRIAWLILEKKIKPDEILAVTFTEKAAGEMEERVDQLLPYGYVDLWISTFHSFCERILKDHAIDIGLPGDLKLLNQTEQWLLVRQNLERFNLDYYRPLGNPTKFIHSLLKHFSRAKDEEIWPEAYLNYAEELKLNQDGAVKRGKHDRTANNFQFPISNFQTNSKSQIQNTKDEIQDIKRLEEVASAYHTYQQLLLENNALDFGDLINYTLKLFRTRPAILEKYRQKFKYILVDEFQDTNWAQYELIKMLAAPKNNLTVVGDDDQCLPGAAVIDLKNGKKMIKDVEVGDEVLTAVGKGHVGVSRVSKVFRNKKQVKLLTIRTKNGCKVEVTDNHKMFCYVPRVSDKKYYYIYLMYRQGLGWRIGVTNDLALRLRLERSADKIIGIKACQTEEEARFYETLWSLSYGIPTSCFKERDDTMIKGKWLLKLYNKINVEENVKRLAEDLNIDLDAYHYCLDAVRRGNKSRIVINFELCHRKYRSKDHVRRKKLLILNPSVTHCLTLETSDQKIVQKLKKAGFNLHKAKKGFRFRILSQDIKKLAVIAKKIKKLTQGTIEYKFNLGKINYQHLPALVMPAKNLMVGHYLPIRIGKDIIYDQIVKIVEKESQATVYDLEVNQTHNFIADGVVVHNSIYKFRGASISNILQFKNDYPDCREIIITDNYRSKQNILDWAYKFIKQNDPNRLEAKLGISKKLIARRNGDGIIEHIYAKTADAEARAVAEKILELKNKEKAINWQDFAILVRANNQAEMFMQVLDQYGIPYQFLASSGLYSKPIILDIIAYLKLLDNYHESSAVYRILNMPIIDMAYDDIVKLNYMARKKNWSLYETMKNAAAVGISGEGLRKINKILGFIARHTSLARERGVGKTVFKFLEDFNYLATLTRRAEKGDLRAVENISYINQFLKKVDEFERANSDRSLKNFMAELDMALESGEEGSLTSSFEEGPEAIKILTVHGAKGLEFKYVFVVNLVDLRFPSTDRKEPIEMPDALVKEIVPEGDIHLEEERRLFYVAITRARDGVFFTSASDYGGQRKKKLSRFLVELGFVEPETKVPTDQVNFDDENERNARLASHQGRASSTIQKYWSPSKFSFTQLKAFETCPLQYKFAHILMVPVGGKFTFSFGKTMHSTLQKFFDLMIKKENHKQADLLNLASTPISTSILQSIEVAKKNKSAPLSNIPSNIPSLDELLKIYDESWINDWYESKSHHDEYKKKGREILREFYRAHEGSWPKVKYLEKGFNLKINNYTIRGVIDRIDEVSGGVEIVDYKTGSMPKDKKYLDKDQLLIYQVAAGEVLGEKPILLSYYFLDENKKISFLGTEEDLRTIREKIIATIEEIKKSDFSPKPNLINCKNCDFKDICEHRIL